MNKIIRKTEFSELVVRFDIEAPRIAKARKAGTLSSSEPPSMGERTL
jgi:hypothetical protein